MLKIGDTVYQTDGVNIYKSRITNIYCHNNFTIYDTTSIAFDERAINHSIFLSEEAVLNERMEVKL